MHRTALRFVVVVSCCLPAAAQVQWSQVAASNAPQAFCGSAWDSLRGRLVAFGGQVGTQQTAVTREWDGAAWQVLSPVQAPSVRSRPAMAFDAARGVTLLFGGGISGNNDTWTWNGTAWTQLAPATVPPPRTGAAMAYDAARQVVVMFGGTIASNPNLADLWEWNGVDWTQRAFSGGPQGRSAHRMVFDAARGVTLLFGGYDAQTFGTLGDTWTWNGAAWTFHAMAVPTRSDPAMVFDTARQRVVMFGGVNITGLVPTGLSDTWEWDGGWAQRAPSTSPSPRHAAASGYDTVNRRVLVGGGIAGTAAQPTTWALAPTTPATVSAYGVGCPGWSGQPSPTAASLPYIGSPFVYGITDGPAFAIALVAFGGSATQWGGLPLPLDLGLFGLPGCTLLTSLDLLVTVLIQNGSGSATWTLPFTPSAVGLPFYTQGIVLDPLLVGPLPFALTEGLAWTIGAP